MAEGQLSWVANFIWGIADDVVVFNKSIGGPPASMWAST
jgi:hypothetical protein